MGTGLAVLFVLAGFAGSADWRRERCAIEIAAQRGAWSDEGNYYVFYADVDLVAYLNSPAARGADAVQVDECRLLLPVYGEAPRPVPAGSHVLVPVQSLAKMERLAFGRTFGMGDGGGGAEGLNGCSCGLLYSRNSEWTEVRARLIERLSAYQEWTRPRLKQRPGATAGFLQ